MDQKQVNAIRTLSTLLPATAATAAADQEETAAAPRMGWQEANEWIAQSWDAFMAGQR